MKNKNGFTMIELLATITILGILMTVAIGSVSLIIKKGRENYYRSQRNNLIAAAKSYYQSNISLLPKDLGDTSTVTLKTLNDNKYIDKLLAADKKTPCDPNATKVVITKTDKNKYKYKSYLKCGEINETQEAADESATYKVTPLRVTDQPGPLTYYLYIEPEGATTAKIKNYTYTITKNGYHYYGPISDNANSTKVKTRTFQIDEESNLKDNTFIAIVKVLDEKGVNHTYSANLYIGDNEAPKCTITSPVPPWTKTKLSIEVACNDPQIDGYASGCEKGTYKVTIKSKERAMKYKQDGIKMLDNAGNVSYCPVASHIRWDDEPPTCPTITALIKETATDLTSRPTRATQLASNNWSQKWLYTDASGSRDQADGKVGQGSGVKHYFFTTRGATTNETKKIQSYRNIDAEGYSTIKYGVCDNLDNCTDNCPTYIAKLDRTAPTIKMKTHQCTTSTKVTGNAINTFTANNTTKLKTTSPTDFTKHVNGWLNGTNYPNGLCLRAEYTDNVALASRNWQWNTSGKQKNATGYQTLNGGSNPATYQTSDYNNYTTSITSDHSFTAEGHRYGLYTVTDAAGNSSAVSIDTLLDRTGPTCPTVNALIKNSATDLTSTPTGLSPITSNSWSSKWLYTYPSGSTDLSGIKEYFFTTTGATTNETKKVQSYRNIDAEGYSTIKYGSRDNAGNENNSCTAYIAKLDRTAPKIKVDAFKCDSNNNKTGSAIKTYNAATTLTISSSTMPNAHNEWLNNANYANGVCFITTYTDESAIAKREWKFNAAGKKLTDSYQVFDNSESPKTKTSYNTTDKNSYTKSESYENKLNSQGVRYGEFIVNDAAGNSAKATITMKIDKSAPTITTKAYKCNSSDEADTSSQKGEETTSSNATLYTKELADVNENYWANAANYPNGICMKTNVTDNNAIASKYWGWNASGYNYDSSDTSYQTIPNDAEHTSTASYNITTPTSFIVSRDYTHKLKSDGHRYGKLQMTDIAGNTSTMEYSYKIDKTAPTVTIEGDSDNYKLTATTKTKVSQITKAHWDNNDWTNVTNSWERTANSSQITTSGSRSYSAMDTAGNIGTATHAAYKACDSTENLGNSYPTTQQVAAADGHVLTLYPKASLTYKWTHDSSKDQCVKNASNTYNRPKRAYQFEEYGCKCNVDKHNGKYCSYNGYIDYTAATHPEGYAYVYYNNTDNGVKSCKNEQKNENPKIHYVNTYVYQVCRDGTDFEETADDPNTNIRTHMNYHGYRWYSGTGDNSITKYHAFDHDYWTHTGHINDTYNSRIPKTTPITDSSVCIHACKATYGSNVG